MTQGVPPWDEDDGWFIDPELRELGLRWMRRRNQIEWQAAYDAVREWMDQRLVAIWGDLGYGTRVEFIGQELSEYDTRRERERTDVPA